MLRLYRRLLEFRRSARAFEQRPRGAYWARALDDHTVLLDYTAGVAMVARLSGPAGAVALDLPVEAQVVLTSEDPDVAPDAQPIGVDRAGGLTLRFSRPGAVLLTWHA